MIRAAARSARGQGGASPAVPTGEGGLGVTVGFAGLGHLPLRGFVESTLDQQVIGLYRETRMSSTVNFNVYLP